MIGWIKRLALVAALVPAVAAAADDPPGPAEAVSRPMDPAAPAQSGAPSPKSLWPGLPFDIWYLWGEDGRPVVIPDKVNVRDFLEWLARKRRKQEDPIPYAVTSIACTGAVVDDRLQLDVVLKLSVTADDEWVRVPIALVEGILLEPPAHDGPGEAILPPFNQETGFTWQIKGAGAHGLRLKLAVPVRKPGVGRRVQLSLPPTAQSSLRLTLPYGRVTAKTAEKSDLEVNSEGNSTEIRVMGLGTRLDLHWQQLPETNTADTRLEAITSVTATLAALEQLVTLEATQTIRAEGQQGNFDEVQVTLPPGSELQNVSCPEYKDHKPDPANPQRVIVKLTRPTSGPINLRWTVRAPLPAAGEPFVLEGFDVARARIQSGLLAVAVVGDFRLAQLPDEDKFVQRINPLDLPPALRQTRTVAAYRFLTRLRLKLALHRIEPFVSATTVAWLRVDPAGLELETTCALEIRGSVSEVALRWPGWKEQGWLVESLDAVGKLDGSSPDLVRIDLDEPARDKLELKLRARRPAIEGDTPVPLSLPVAAASPGLSLTVIRPENVEVALSAQDGTTLLPDPRPPRRAAVPRDLSRLPHDEYRVESADARLNASVTLHPREIATSTAVEAAWRSGTITVRQQIDYDITYDSLTHVNLAIPPGLELPQIRLGLVDGAELPLRSSMRQPSGVWRIPLDRPRTGHFELELKYSFESTRPTERSDEQPVLVPLATSEDAEFLSTRFQWHDAEGRDASIAGDGWTRLPDPDGVWIWTLPRGVAEVEASLTRGRGGWRGAAVSRALLQSSVGLDGTIQTQADYQLSGAGPGLTIALPEGVELVSVRWNRQLLKRVPQPQVDGEGASTYSLALDRGSGGNGLLSVELVQGGAVLSRFAGPVSLAAPRLPEGLPVLDCLWRVTLPAGQHLFVEPLAFAPEFQWRRSGLFWQRLPNRNESELEAWVDPDRIQGDTVSESGNDYLFSRGGEPASMQIIAMSRPGIVLVGAGAALGLGLLLVYWPAARHAVTVLAVGFAIALLAVWYSGPVLVLLQPAGLGVLLAVGAATIQSLLQRKRTPISVTLSSPSGFLTSSSSVSPSPALSAGSNEYTSVRNPAPIVIDPPHAVGQFSQSASPP